MPRNAVRALLWIVASLAWFSAMFYATIVVRLGGMPSTTSKLLLVASIPYVALAWMHQRALRTSTNEARDWRLWCALGLAAPVVAMCWNVSPVFSDDVYRFVCEGRAILEGINPYVTPPSDPRVASVCGAELASRVNHAHLTTLYPPLIEACFASIAFAGGAVGAMKVFATLGWFCGVILIHRVGVRDTGSAQTPHSPLWLALHPMVIAETAMNAHFDIWAGVAMLAVAIGLGAGSRSVARSLGVAVGGVIVAVGVKLVGLIALPLLWVRSRRAFVVALALVLVSLAPLVVSVVTAYQVGSTQSGAMEYARHWNGNESLFAVVRAVVVDGLGAFGVDYSVTSMLARAVGAACVFAVAWLCVRSGLRPAVTLRYSLLAVLLLSPQVHPWYLLWLVPLDVAVGGWVAVVWCVAVLPTYFAYDAWVLFGRAAPSLAIRAMEYIAVVVALLAELRFRPTR